MEHLDVQEGWRRWDILERFTFEDEDEHEYKIELNEYFCACSKKDTPEKFILLFFAKKVSPVIYTEGDWAQTLPIAKW